MKVTFVYHTGILAPLFSNVKLVGSWDNNGFFSYFWTSRDMQAVVQPDGTHSFQTIVDFPDEQVGTRFEWGVSLDGPSGQNKWGIATEVQDVQSNRCVRSFELRNPEVEEYFLTHLSRLGDNVEGK